MKAPRYNLLQDYGASDDTRHVAADPHWIVAIVRSGDQMTYDRATGRSIDIDPGSAAGPRDGRTQTLIISDDVESLNLQRPKRSHIKHLNINLKAGRDYNNHILPGDWVLVWLMNNREDYQRVLGMVRAGEQANGVKDGFKFLGRVLEMSKSMRTDPMSGRKEVEYAMKAVGFNELETSIFYDLNIATNDVVKENIGKWLTRIGVDAHTFLSDVTGEHPKEGNINEISKRILDLIIGKGVKSDITPPQARSKGLNSAIGGGAQTGAPNAYVVPKDVGLLLGRQTTDSGTLAYADLLDMIQGVQSYEDQDGLNGFFPKVGAASEFTRYITPTPLLGTFYINFMDLLNKSLWSVMTQYVNPAINEMYTAVRVAEDGQTVMPMLVFRQIPRTTEAYVPPKVFESDGAPEETEVPVTRFLSLPRWVLPGALTYGYSLTRTDATRTNFVHVYGSASMSVNTWAVGQQMALDPPLVDEADVMRSGVRPLMTTVECVVDDTKDRTPGKWMRLIADWSMGQHLYMTGTVSVQGIQAPIAEGDNLEMDGVVYHIETIDDSVHIDSQSGRKQWRTNLSLSNGTVVEAFTDKHPGYPMINNRLPDPGQSYDPARDVTRSDHGSIGDLYRGSERDRPMPLGDSKTETLKGR